MKHIILIFIITITFFSCGDQNRQEERIVSESSGRINNLSVVIDNDLWEGSIGKTIRDSIGVAVYGLPQDEPSFTMSQMPPSVFTGFTRKNRTVLKIEKGKPTDTKYYENAYARPQRVVVVSGNTNKEIVDEIVKNQTKIISTFKNTEIKENQRRIKKSLHKNNNLEEKLGLTISFPTAYRVATEQDNFFWLRKDIRTGTLNLMVYEMPLNTISKDENAINDVIRMRDSIGQAYIPGPLEGTYMITEDAYTPFIGQTILDNKPTTLTKSTWEVKGAFMSGPFINYAIEDRVNNRLVVIEGFAFAPSVAKRDHMFELEAIIKSIKIK